MLVPVIDISALYKDDPEAWEVVEDKLYDAHTTVGFSILTGHGVPTQWMDDLFAQSAGFYALPLEQKLAYRYGANLRGVQWNGTGDHRSVYELPRRRTSCCCATLGTC